MTNLCMLLHKLQVKSSKHVTYSVSSRVTEDMELGMLPEIEVLNV